MEKLTRNFAFLVLAIFIFSFVAETAGAQPRKARERLCQAKKMKLLQILDLSDETADKFITVYSKYDKKISDKRKEMDDLSAELKSIVDAGTKTADFKGLATKLEAAWIEMHDLTEARMKEVKAVLSDEEYAKFLAFENEFPKEVQKMIMQHRKGGKRD